MAETSINDLPVELLRQIQGFLPAIDAIRYSLVSRQWRNLWHRIPTLNFDMESFYDSSRPQPLDLSQSRHFFSEFISQTLLIRPHDTASLKSFRLFFSYLNYPRAHFAVDSWLRYAIASGAKHLLFSFLDYGECDGPDLSLYKNYEFHFFHLKNSSSVEILELYNCNIVWAKTVPPCGGGFNSLKTLYLNCVTLPGGDDEFSAMVSSCFNLERLDLYSVEGLRKFKIVSKSLNVLKLGFQDLRGAEKGCLEICAPNLCKIYFDCFHMTKYCSKDLSSLVEAHVDFRARGEDNINCWRDVMRLLSTGCVERLIVQNMFLNRIRWLKVFDTEDISGDPPFKNLKYLELQTGYDKYDLVGIVAFLELCPDLETLVLDYVYKTDGSLAEDFKDDPVTLHIPSVKQVKMKRYNGTEKELYFVELLKTHKVVLQKVVAFPEKVDEGFLPPVILFDNVTSLEANTNI